VAPGPSFITRDTVDRDTPATRATSAIVSFDPAMLNRLNRLTPLAAISSPSSRRASAAPT
jgi:hypothetical protein